MHFLEKQTALFFFFLLQNLLMQHGEVGEEEISLCTLPWAHFPSAVHVYVCTQEADVRPDASWCWADYEAGIHALLFLPLNTSLKVFFCFTFPLTLSFVMSLPPLLCLCLYSSLPMESKLTARSSCLDLENQRLLISDRKIGMIGLYQL